MTELGMPIGATPVTWRSVSAVARAAAFLALSFVCVACAGHLDAGGASVSPFDGNSFIVRNVRVFDGEHVHEGMNVVVEAGRVTAVGGQRQPAGLPVIDGTGRTLLPGFIDAHAHVLSEGHLRNALRFGVTTQLDMFTRVEFMQAHKAQRDQNIQTDLSDLYSAGAPVTSAGGMGTQFGIPFPTIAGPQEARAFVRARLAEGSDYIKILYEPSVDGLTSISRETLAAVIEAAHAEGARAIVHITSLEGARDAVRAGADGLAHFLGDETIDEAFAAEIASRGVFVTPTLSLFAAVNGHGLGPELAADPRLSPYLTEAQRGSLMEAAPDAAAEPYLLRFDIARATENVRRLHAAGVRILAGDDTPNLSTHGASMHGELVLLTRAGLSPAEALRAATLSPAQAFGLDDRGRIALGARADLMLVDGNPLSDIEVTRVIVHVFKNGFDVPRLRPSAAVPAS